MTELHNWFIVPGGVHRGTYRVEGGALPLPFLRDGQYFRILGSVFNDGLHQHPAPDLRCLSKKSIWQLMCNSAATK